MAPQRIPEFHIRQMPDGRWQAAARYEITPRLAALGARSVICADTLFDLEVLCTVERGYIARLHQAAPQESEGAELSQVIALETGHVPYPNMAS